MPLSFSNQQLLTAFTAAAPYLPRTADVFYTILPTQTIGFAELADVCDALGQDFSSAMTQGIPPAVFHPHLKSMVLVLHGSAVLGNGQSDAWRMFSAGLSRMTMGVTPASFHGLAQHLRTSAG